MAKARKQTAEPAPETDHEVRLTAKMPRSVRFRLRMVALSRGENLEDMTARWLAERLAAEEKALGIKP